jgi:predicted transcriptional regulator
MITRFADTFMASLTRLQPQEQKQTKLTAMDLQIDPTGKGLSWHRIERSRDPDFWSVRVSRDLRLIVHKKGDALLLAYVDHHDAAYNWAERKRIEVHPRTGAAQFVEMPVVMADEESLDRSAEDKTQDAALNEPQPFWALSDNQLLNVGVPPDWLEPVRETRESEVSDLCDRLPGEAAEALLDVATGGDIADHIAPVAENADPFEHPDAERRFRTVENLEELKAALDQPFERWAVFLHPAQRDVVTRNWSGPARVSGTAGTGKTIVALHRAVHLAGADDNARILLTTFSAQLSDALAAKCNILTETDTEARKRITVEALDDVALKLYRELVGQAEIATDAQIGAIVAKAIEDGRGGTLPAMFLVEEWREVADAWQVHDQADYEAVPRLGRKTRLGVPQREIAWEVFERVNASLANQGLVTWPQIYARLADADIVSRLPFTHAVVDEAQDLSVAQLKFLSTLGSRSPDALFFAGDIGQRIFRLPFSWLKLGVDIRGRSQSLKVCYRTSHQIRAAADRLLPDIVSDLDGIEEGRRGTVSTFDGPPPLTILLENDRAEIEAVSGFLRSWLAEGIEPTEIGVLARGEKQLQRVHQAIAEAGAPAERIITTTMHGAKGLEFRAVAVMACDDDVIPDPARLSAVGDAADLATVYDTERHLLYVACTRARDRLLVSGVKPGSEFLEDFA